MSSLIVLGLLLVFVASANPVARLLGVDPYETDLLSQYSPPSAAHPLGTDDAGRDELVRLMLGGQISLLVGVLSTLAGSVIGLTLGVVSGYFGKRLDAVLMRFTDGVIALPLLPLLIVLGALDLTKLGFSAEFAHSGAAGFWRVVVIVALVDWTGIARLNSSRHARATGARLCSFRACERRSRRLHHDRPHPAKRCDAVDRRRYADDRAGDPVRSRC